ncbi:hypothetical protein OG909_01430 [Streptomyces sp. NBC_01754]|uniref:hypothetical protein n=1 Tax=Streptomyces sp. NBC_01754 TaxID=2975930 RepID=UPI002DD929A0|nr:hypothetical protein [Streptomyces sp. NBC_01754]WSC91070.1 hypothetical protein OG909_01430 [Streptomyces sp. NBC_01754]
MHRANAVEETLSEFYRCAVAAVDAERPSTQPAFFLARHLAELALKTLLRPGQKHGHDLDKLRKQVQESGDDLFTDDEDRRSIVAFVRDLHSHDPKGDQGCYATTTSGDPSLAAVC